MEWQNRGKMFEKKNGQTRVLGNPAPMEKRLKFRSAFCTGLWNTMSGWPISLLLFRQWAYLWPKFSCIRFPRQCRLICSLQASGYLLMRTDVAENLICIVLVGFLGTLEINNHIGVSGVDTRKVNRSRIYQVTQSKTQLGGGWWGYSINFRKKYVGSQTLMRETYTRSEF